MNTPKTLLTTCKRALPLMAVFCLPAAHAVQAPAGGVFSSVGEVKAINPQGVARPLSKGAKIDQGDTIHTAPNARAQIRFSDGAMVALQPESQFRIDEYQFSGKADGQEKGFFSLIKGGLRTLTGWVGRSNRDNYKLSTAVATIGIRGTGYTVFITPGNELQASVGEGAIAIYNTAGELLLRSGESGIVSGPNNAPRRLETLVHLPPMQPQPSAGASEVFNSTEKYQPGTAQPDSGLFAGALPQQPNPGQPTPGQPTPGQPTPGQPTPEQPTPQPPTPQPPTPGQPAMPVHNTTHAVLYSTFNQTGVLAAPYEFDASNHLVKIYKGGVSVPLSQIGMGSLGDAIYYGLWNGVSGGELDGANSTFWYLAGTPVMPAASATYSFASLGSVSAYSTTGVTAGDIPYAQLTARLEEKPSLALDMKVLVENTAYQINGMASNFASGSFGFQRQTVSATGARNESFNADGFFAGSSANLAAMSFAFKRPDMSANDDVWGTAAFKKDDTPLPPVQNTGRELHYLARYTGNGVDGGKLDKPYEFDEAREKLVKFDRGGVATPLSQSAGNYDGALYYGTWSGVSGGKYDGAGSAFHYLAGDPVAMPSASARYNLLSGPATQALASNADGVSFSSGYLSTTLSAAPFLNLNLKLAAANSTYTVEGSTTDVSDGKFTFASLPVSGSTGASNSSFAASGFFTGETARYAGLSFAFMRPDLASDNGVNGIAAFVKDMTPLPVSNTSYDVHYLARYDDNDLDSGQLDAPYRFDDARQKLVEIYKDGVATPRRDSANRYQDMLYFGEWNGVSGGKYDGSGSTFHYLAGEPVMPAASARYDLLFPPSRALAENADRVSFVSGRLGATFDTVPQPHLSLDMKLAAASSTYAIEGSSTNISGGRFEFDDLSVASHTGARNTSFDAKGFFTGSSAQYAGMSFEFKRPDLASKEGIEGIAAFERYVEPPPPPPPPPPPAPEQTSGTVLGLYATNFPAHYELSFLTPVNGSASNVSNVTSFTASGQTYAPSATPLESSNLNSVIYWGKWAVGNITGSAVPGAFQHLRYIAAANTVTPTDPTGNMLATYNFVNGSGPFDGNYEGSITNGRINIDFNASKLAIEMNVSLASNAYKLTQSAINLGATFSFSGGMAKNMDTGAANNFFAGDGLFAGTGASHAGLVFEFLPPGQNFKATGAAAFTRQ